jgi:hypothetical protein
MILVAAEVLLGVVEHLEVGMIKFIIYLLKGVSL